MGHARVDADAYQGRWFKPGRDFGLGQAESAQRVVYGKDAARRQAKTIQERNLMAAFLEIARQVEQARGHERNTAVQVARQMYQRRIDQCDARAHVILRRVSRRPSIAAGETFQYSAGGTGRRTRPIEHAAFLRFR